MNLFAGTYDRKFKNGKILMPKEYNLKGLLFAKNIDFLGQEHIIGFYKNLKQRIFEMEEISENKLIKKCMIYENNSLYIPVSYRNIIENNNNKIIIFGYLDNFAIYSKENGVKLVKKYDENFFDVANFVGR